MGNRFMNVCIQPFQTPYGDLILGDYNNQLCLCDWKHRGMRQTIDNRIREGLNADFEEKKTDLIGETMDQLNDYFLRRRTVFSIPLLLVGTLFQKSTWNELMKIPYGKTESYLGLSKKLNNPQAVRAVAAANGANAISIIIPCHRIVGNNKELVGYAGGIDVKQKLLRLENPVQFAEQLKLFG